MRWCASSPAPVRSASSGAGRRCPTEAVVEVLMALAGPDGLATRLGDELVELECNPVLVTPAGAVALDARLILRDAPGRARTAAGQRLHPPVRAARDRGRGRVGDAEQLRQPRARRVPRVRLGRRSATRCTPTPRRSTACTRFADLAAVDAPIDYLLVAVPAARCADVVRATAGRVPFVHVISGGFDEIGAEGAALSDDLLAAGARGEDTRDRPELHRRVQPRRATSVPARTHRATSAV